MLLFRRHIIILLIAMYAVVLVPLAAADAPRTVTCRYAFKNSSGPLDKDHLRGPVLIDTTVIADFTWEGITIQMMDGRFATVHATAL